MEDTVREVIDRRLEAEFKGGDYRPTIEGKDVSEHPAGYEFSYHGVDESGRRFSYSGIISRGGIISVYVESLSGNAERVQSVMESAMRSLKIN